MLTDIYLGEYWDTQPVFLYVEFSFLSIFATLFLFHIFFCHPVFPPKHTFSSTNFSFYHSLLFTIPFHILSYIFLPFLFFSMTDSPFTLADSISAYPLHTSFSFQSSLFTVFLFNFLLSPLPFSILSYSYSFQSFPFQSSPFTTPLFNPLLSLLFSVFPFSIFSFHHSSFQSSLIPTLFSPSLFNLLLSPLLFSILSYPYSFQSFPFQSSPFTTPLFNPLLSLLFSVLPYSPLFFSIVCFFLFIFKLFFTFLTICEFHSFMFCTCYFLYLFFILILFFLFSCSLSLIFFYHVPIGNSFSLILIIFCLLTSSLYQISLQLHSICFFSLFTISSCFSIIFSINKRSSITTPFFSYSLVLFFLLSKILNSFFFSLTSFLLDHFLSIFSGFIFYYLQLLQSIAPLFRDVFLHPVHFPSLPLFLPSFLLTHHSSFDAFYTLCTSPFFPLPSFFLFFFLSSFLPSFLHTIVYHSLFQDIFYTLCTALFLISSSSLHPFSPFLPPFLLSHNLLTHHSSFVSLHFLTIFFPFIHLKHSLINSSFSLNLSIFSHIFILTLLHCPYFYHPPSVPSPSSIYQLLYVFYIILSRHLLFIL
ncbi:unnamed protein product [Acanthosepion pharaonis]|uniref:Uncharacterized protein n=1 Tax=Acanthosepion pharaonis TaxID=158019 RepID=A0A812BQZ4_ACAPH|nr:unnamed protein product [Sepia pharaonis]